MHANTTQSKFDVSRVLPRARGNGLVCLRRSSRSGRTHYAFRRLPASIHPDEAIFGKHVLLEIPRANRVRAYWSLNTQTNKTLKCFFIDDPSVSVVSQTVCGGRITSARSRNVYNLSTINRWSLPRSRHYISILTDKSRPGYDGVQRNIGSEIFGSDLFSSVPR